MKIISNPIHHDSMSCIISSSASGADICLTAEDVDKFPLPLVSELGAQNDGSHGCGSCGACFVWSPGWVVGSGVKMGRVLSTRKKLLHGAAKR